MMSPGCATSPYGDRDFIEAIGGRAFNGGVYFDMRDRPSRDQEDSQNLLSDSEESSVSDNNGLVVAGSAPSTKERNSQGGFSRLFKITCVLLFISLIPLAFVLVQRCGAKKTSVLGGGDRG
jgi:hypothetical protein